MNMKSIAGSLHERFQIMHKLGVLCTIMSWGGVDSAEIGSEGRSTEQARLAHPGAILSDVKILSARKARDRYNAPYEKPLHGRANGSSSVLDDRDLPPAGRLRGRWVRQPGFGVAGGDDLRSSVAKRRPAGTAVRSCAAVT